MISKIKFVFTCLFFSIAGFLSAQQPIELEVKKLEKALVEKDTIVLKQLLHKDLSYGHSNGWIETRTEMIENIVSGKMQYKSIISEAPEFSQTGDVMRMRTKSKICFVVNSKEGELNLFVQQVWKKEGDEWKLLVRQSTKLN